MFSTPSSKATVTSDHQLEFSVAHLTAKEPVFICTWFRSDAKVNNGTGSFFCSHEGLLSFLNSENVSTLAMLQILTPSISGGWVLRTALTVAQRYSDDPDLIDLVFSDDLEIFDSWSERHQRSSVLVPLWSAPL